MDVVELTKRLVRASSVNPPGGTREVVEILAGVLEPAGFRLSRLDTPGQGENLVAVLPGNGGKPALCFTGHMDTVPLGEATWSIDPFGGVELNGLVYGRGVSDMKSGLAAMTAGVLPLAGVSGRSSDIVMLFTAGEEVGCQGALDLASSGLLPDRAGALVVGEPTDCLPGLGHKGVLWLRADFTGKSAHGSMPDAGENAILKAARAAVALEKIFAGLPAAPGLGAATVNVGVISGGGKINMVPDSAYLEIDLRCLPGQNHDEVERKALDMCGHGTLLRRLTDFPAVLTDANDPWVERVLALFAREAGKRPEPRYLSYFTDASVLTRAMGEPPTLFFGPGPARQAHQTDEFCPVADIRRAAALCEAIAREWVG
jgi:succinyl-diaminopimelate desuccinylase